MRIFLKSYLAAATVVLLGIDKTYAQEEITFVTYAEYILTDYALEGKGTVLAPDNSFRDVDSAFLVNPSALKIGAGAAYKSFYTNIYFQGTSDAKDSFTIPIVGDLSYKGNRKEWSVALGQQLASNINIFVGYRDSKIEGRGSQQARFSFENDGFFLGASYRLALTESGGLTFTFGHAWLDSSARQNISGVPVGEGTGNGTGVKFGVGWRDEINDDWTYSVGVDSFTYKHDHDSDSVNFDWEESEVTLGIGLAYAF